MPKVHVRTGDEVVVISGKWRGKRGEVMQVAPKEGKVIVKGAGIVSKHIKPRKMGEQGGIIKAEGPLYASKVQLVCPKCHQPTRIGHTFDEKGEKHRVCKNPNCGKLID
ncbi:MAG: 50S ribosomal protein L24 [Oscillospiraceae bacterium]|nr:50S ribosomal protein L24 [Oscillospiraceae bacterium]